MFRKNEHLKRKRPPGRDEHIHTNVSMSANFEHAALSRLFEWVDGRGRTSDSCHCHLYKWLEGAAVEMRHEEVREIILTWRRLIHRKPAVKVVRQTI